MIDDKIESYEHFDPRAYISEYYSRLGAENQFLLRFYHDVFSRLPQGLCMLECGGGPTVYQLFSASRKATDIVFTDYLPSNLKEVAAWLANEPQAFSWEQFSKAVAKLELQDPSDLVSHADVIEQRTRAAISKIITCDALAPELPPEIGESRFDVVSSGFCLECIGHDEAAFVRAISNIVQLIAPSGHLILTLLKNSNGYLIGDSLFPAFPVDTDYMRNLMASLSLKIVELRETPAEEEQGYQGLIALLAIKS